MKDKCLTAFRTLGEEEVSNSSTTTTEQRKSEQMKGATLRYTSSRSNITWTRMKILTFGQMKVEQLLSDEIWVRIMFWVIVLLSRGRMREIKQRMEVDILLLTLLG